MVKKYYKILGLEVGASLNELEERYNYLIEEFNPEKQEGYLKEFFKNEQENVKEAYNKVLENIIELKEEDKKAEVISKVSETSTQKNIVKKEKKPKLIPFISVVLLFVIVGFIGFYNNYQTKLKIQREEIQDLRFENDKLKQENKQIDFKITKNKKRKQEDKSYETPPPEVIEIVEDEVEIEKELEIEDTETDEDEIIEIEEEDDEEFFMVVENMPEFPGGDLGLMKFIQKNVKYPAIAKEYNITGKVYVSFIVDKQGKVTNVKIVRGVDKNLDGEALRVVSALPNYKPGKQRGKPVRVMFTIPINFTLN